MNRFQFSLRHFFSGLHHTHTHTQKGCVANQVKDSYEIWWNNYPEQAKFVSAENNQSTEIAYFYVTECQRERWGEKEWKNKNRKKNEE